MDREVAIELLKREKDNQALFVNMSGMIGISKEYTDEGRATIEALDLAIEALQESADKYTNATTNLYNSRLAKDLMGISEEAEKLRMFDGDAESAMSEEEVDYCNNCPYISWGIEARRYTFGNDEFSLEAAYHDCKLVFDGITDDDSFQEADAGLVFYYANEIIYALHEAIESLPPVTHDIRTETHGVCSDCISREKILEHAYMRDGVMSVSVDAIKLAPSVTPTERTGEWEYEPSNGVNRCSVCGTGFRNGFCIRNVEAFNFCPNCGAMLGGDEE